MAKRYENVNQWTDSCSSCWTAGLKSTRYFLPKTTVGDNSWYISMPWSALLWHSKSFFWVVVKLNIWELISDWSLFSFFCSVQMVIWGSSGNRSTSVTPPNWILNYYYPLNCCTCLIGKCFECYRVKLTSNFQYRTASGHRDASGNCPHMEFHSKSFASYIAHELLNEIFEPTMTLKLEVA